MKHCEKTLSSSEHSRHEGRSAAGGWLRKSRFQKTECLDYGGSFSGICDSRDAFPKKSDGILDLGAIDDGMCAVGHLDTILREDRELCCRKKGFRATSQGLGLRHLLVPSPRCLGEPPGTLRVRDELPLAISLDDSSTALSLQLATLNEPSFQEI